MGSDPTDKPDAPDWIYADGDGFWRTMPPQPFGDANVKYIRADLAHPDLEAMAEKIAVRICPETSGTSWAAVKAAREEIAECVLAILEGK